MTHNINPYYKFLDSKNQMSTTLRYMNCWYCFSLFMSLFSSITLKPKEIKDCADSVKYPILINEIMISCISLKNIHQNLYVICFNCWNSDNNVHVLWIRVWSLLAANISHYSCFSSFRFLFSLLLIYRRFFSFFTSFTLYHQPSSLLNLL